MPGYCKGCGNRSDDSDICDRCDARSMEEQEGPVRQRTYPVSNIRVPYDPDTDPF